MTRVDTEELKMTSQDEDDLQKFISGVVAEGPATSEIHDESAAANFLSEVLGPDSSSYLQPSLGAALSEGTASDAESAAAAAAAAEEAAQPDSPVDPEMPSPQGRRVAPAALQLPPSPTAGGARRAHSAPEAAVVAAAAAAASACSSPTAGGGGDPCSPQRSPRACSPAGRSEPPTGCGGNLVAGKVKVFVSMHGDPLLKSMLMPGDIAYDEFVRRIEQKLHAQDLRVYYHEGGDRVEVDDDDSVACFFATATHDAKMRLSVFPAEIIGARPARSFVPADAAASSLGASSSLLQHRALSASVLRRGTLAYGCGGAAAAGHGMGRRASSYSRGGWQSTLGGVECARSAAGGQLAAGCYGGR